MSAQLIEQIHTLQWNQAYLTFTTQLIFQISQQPGQTNFQMHIDDKFQIVQKPRFFELRQLKRESLLGEFPFSISTYQQWYSDPTLYNFDTIVDNIQDLQNNKDSVKLSTKIFNLPYRLPIYSLNPVKRRLQLLLPLSNHHESRIVICCGTQISSQTYQDKWQSIFEISKDIRPSRICFIIPRQLHRRILLFGQNKICIWSKYDESYLSDNSHFDNLLKDCLSRVRRMTRIKDLHIIRDIDHPLTDGQGIVIYQQYKKPLFQCLVRCLMGNAIRDQWILAGISLISTCPYQQNCQRQQLYRRISEGEEFSPLSDNQYCSDSLWRLKAAVVFTSLANSIDSHNILNSILLNLTTVGNVTTSIFLQHVRNKCGMDLTSFRTYIETTGLPCIKYQKSRYNNPEGKTRLLIRQNPVQHPSYQYYNFCRIMLDKIYELKSIHIRALLSRYKDIYEGKQEIEHMTQPNELSGCLLIPCSLQAPCYFSEVFEVEVTQYERYSETKDVHKVELRDNGIGWFDLNRRHEKKEQDNWFFSDVQLEVDARWRSPADIQLKKPTEAKLIFYFNHSSNEKSIIKILELMKPSSAVIEVVLSRLRKQCDTDAVQMKMLDRLTEFSDSDEYNVEAIWTFYTRKIHQYYLFRSNEKKTKMRTFVLKQLPLLSYKQQYLQNTMEMQRYLLKISEDSPEIDNQVEECQYREALFSALLRHQTIHSPNIVRHVAYMLPVYGYRMHRNTRLIVTILEKTYGFGNTGCPVVRKHLEQIDKTMVLFNNNDVSSLLWFTLHKIELLEKQRKTMTTSKFIKFIFLWLKNVKKQLYCEALSVVYDLLKKNRDKYALEFQRNQNVNQNALIAYRLWQHLTAEETMKDAKVRALWIKIYRLLYFEFIPVCIMAKIAKCQKNEPFNFKLDSSQKKSCLAMIQDFKIDPSWYLGFRRPEVKQQKVHKERRPRRKRDKNIVSEHCDASQHSRGSRKSESQSSSEQVFMSQ